MATSVVGPRPGSRGMPATTMTPVETTRSLTCDGMVGWGGLPGLVSSKMLALGGVHGGFETDF